LRIELLEKSLKVADLKIDLFAYPYHLLLIEALVALVFSFRSKPLDKDFGLLGY
jgi:hypothetical protein